MSIKNCYFPHTDVTDCTDFQRRFFIPVLSVLIRQIRFYRCEMAFDLLFGSDLSYWRSYRRKSCRYSRSWSEVIAQQQHNQGYQGIQDILLQDAVLQLAYAGKAFVEPLQRRDVDQFQHRLRYMAVESGAGREYP